MILCPIFARALRHLQVGRHRRVVHEDREEPALAELVRANVGGHVAHPRRRWQLELGEIDRHERDDFLRLAVLEHGEVFREQIPDRTFGAIEHRYVDLHEIDTRAEDRLLLRRRRRGLCRSNAVGTAARPATRQGRTARARRLIGRSRSYFL